MNITRVLLVFFAPLLFVGWTVFVAISTSFSTLVITQLFNDLPVKFHLIQHSPQKALNPPSIDDLENGVNSYIFTKIEHELALRNEGTRKEDWLITMFMISKDNQTILSHIITSRNNQYVVTFRWNGHQYAFIDCVETETHPVDLSFPTQPNPEKPPVYVLPDREV